MALRVPPQQITYAKRLIELPDQDIKKFFDALVKIGPQFNVYDLAGELSRLTGLDYNLNLGIIRIATSLYLTKDKDFSNISTEQFVDREVFPALKSADTFAQDKIDSEWKKLREFLLNTLSLERTVGTTAKAGPVLTQHERIFSGAKIMTDLRPIYHLKVSEKPDAAVVIHMLRITERDNFGKHADTYFALDSNDLIALREVIERAMEKEKTLRSVISGSGVTVLNPKLIF